jgi:hypothetical protein
VGKIGNPTRREEPRDLVELAANDALDAAAERLRAGGAESVRMFVILDDVEPVPDGEQNCVAGGTGFEDDNDPEAATAEIVECLLRHAKAAMRSMGKDIQIIDLQRPVGHG